MKFILTPELIIPFIISNAVSICILWLTFRKPNAAEVVLAILFLGAGCFNIYTALSNPDAYLSFGQTTLIPFYKEFIYGFFASHTVIVIASISMAQIFIGFSVLMENRRFQFACIGGIIFSLAIAPLGTGSAFPSTVVLALAFLVLLLKKEAVPDASSFQ